MQLNSLVRRALANPSRGLEAIRAGRAQRGLLDFVRQTWPVLEPGRQFVEGTVVEVLVEHLEAVEKGKIRRLLINVPPGCMKSLLTNVFFPAWVWGPRARPDRRFITWSYAENLPIRDNRKTRLLIQSPEFQRYWGSRFGFRYDENRKMNFENDKTGFKMASGIKGQGMGHRGDFLNLDDPNNIKTVESEADREQTCHFFAEILPSRFNDDYTSIVVIQQRTHERDVSGLILAEGLGYDHLCLPMRYEVDHPFKSRTALGFKDWRTKEGDLLWPERFSEETVAELEKALRSWGGEYAVAGQLQQRPVPRGGGMFKAEWFKEVDLAEVPEIGMTCRGWDLAASVNGHAAYTVGLKMRRHFQHGYFIMDVVRGRWEPGDVDKVQLRCAENDGKDCWQSVPVDPGQSGKDQKRYKANLLSGYRLHFSPESGSKEDRAQPWAAQAHAGNVYMVRAPWNKVLTDEAKVFPKSTFKDQVDAGSRAFNFLAGKKQPNVGGAPIIGN